MRVLGELKDRFGRLARWAPVAAAVAIAAVSVALWRGLATEPSGVMLTPMQSSLPLMVLVCGLLLAVLTMLVIRQALTARQRAEQLASGNRRLQRIIERHLATVHSLRRSQKQVRMLLDCAGEGIYGLDLEGRCTFCNPTCLRLLGYQRTEDLIGRSLHEMIQHTRSDGSPYLSMDCRIHEAFLRGQGVHTDDEVFWRADGTSFPAEYRARPLVRNGIIVGCVVTFTDVTKRSLAEARLRELAEVVEWSQDAIFRVDLDGTIASWNQGAQRLYGYSAPEACGQPVGMLVPPDRQLELAGIQQCIRRRAPLRQFQTVRQRKDGTLFDVSLTVSPLMDMAGRLSGSSIVVRDITARKRAEEVEKKRRGLEDAIRAMEHVLGVVGHELRTPLAAVRATAEYLLTDQTPADPQNAAFLKAIHDETIRMADMVNNMLEAARLNSGRVKWNWATVPIAATCDAAFDAVRPLIDPQRVRLEARISEPDMCMKGDPEAIRRLIINLVSNAAKHTEQGQIVFDAQSLDRPDGQWVRMLVDDSGDGIPDAVREKLGQAFMLNSGVIGKDFIKGAGLGLAICKGIVEAHGGTIRVASSTQRGTRFTIELRADLDGPAQIQNNIIIEQEAA